MDYFLRRDAKCYKLEQDSSEMAKKIELYKNNEALYKANEQDYKGQISVQKTINSNQKIDLVNCNSKYIEAQGKAKFRGKVLLGSLSFNLVFIAVVAAGLFVLKL